MPCRRLYSAALSTPLSLLLLLLPLLLLATALPLLLGLAATDTVLLALADFCCCWGFSLLSGALRLPKRPLRRL